MSFDEIYDEMLHDEFRPSATAPEHRGAHAKASPAGGLSRYRTAALVAGGGMACAVVGAFLGGLGGEFGLNTAGAQALHNSNETIPLSSVSGAAFKVPVIAIPTPLASPTTEVSSVIGEVASNGAAATVAAVSGGLLHGTTSDDPVTSDTPTVTTSAVTTAAAVAPVIENPGQMALGDLTAGLTGVLTNLSGALRGLVQAVTDPADGIGGVVTPLTGVLTDITGTLSNLSTLLPLPTEIGSLPVLAAAAPTVNTGSAVANTVSHTSAGPSTPVAPLVNAVTSLVPSLTGGGGSSSPTSGLGLPAVPSLPLPSVTSLLPSLPIVSTVTSLLPALPAVALPTVPAASTSVPAGSSSSATCVGTPSTGAALPTLVNGTLNLGVVSVGVKLGGSSAATVCVGS